jgi:hypothetical protein
LTVLDQGFNLVQCLLANTTWQARTPGSEALVKVQLATRLDTGLRQRLKIYASVTGRTVEDVVSVALDGYLPPASDMIRDADSATQGDAFLLAEQPEVA